MPLTLEERERHAYIEGRTEEAALLALAIDTENEALEDMRLERDDVQSANDCLTRENEELQEALETSEEKVLTLTADLENVQDEVKALQGQIHEAGIDLL